MSAPTAEKLIARSIAYQEIVTVEWDSDLETDLSLEAEGSGEHDHTLEYWGVTIADEEWRVHLKNAPELTSTPAE